SFTALPDMTTITPASIWINGTAVTQDDVTFEDVPASALIVGAPGATVYLAVTGPAILSQNQVVLDPAGRASVSILSTGPSLTPDDVHVRASVTPAGPFIAAPPAPVTVDEKTLSKVVVTLPDVNRPYDVYNTLPNGSKTHALYRIPARIDTGYEVT